MEKGRNLVPSGIEPVDRLRGGLESGKLYLVHGEGPSKSLFGYQFLIKGLKRGEHVALIINYSPEDAVRWFARLGYDCLEDIYSGRLVVLECAEENFNQISKMKELSPVLSELGWLIGERNPSRVVFEPIGRLVIGERGSTGNRSREFASWAGGIGSTSLMIAKGKSEELINNLLPLVTESFRFELKQEGDLAIRYLFFEKSPDIPGQAVEADPAKGIFLVDRPSKLSALREPPSGHALGAAEVNPSETNRAGESSAAASGHPQASAESAKYRDPFTDLISELLADLQPLQELEATLPESVTPARPDAGEMDRAEHESPALRGPELFGRYEAPVAPLHRRPRIEAMGGSPSDDSERIELGGMVENLLKPPEIAIGVTQSSVRPLSGETASAIHQDLAKQPETGPGDQPRPVRSEDFNVLVIAGDTRSAERITRSLSEYHVEEAREGVSGLAKLISFKPDLVVLDMDLRTVDGFEVLKHIRANLDVPIIAISSSRLRASDRIRSAELGADYYLTRPFSSRELRQKARQLIARYRRIDQWITCPAQETDLPSQQQGRRASDLSDVAEERGLTGTSEGGAQESAKHESGAHVFLESISDIGRWRSGADIQSGGTSEPDRAIMLPYPEFVRRIEQMVEMTIDGDAWFSVVGCRVNHNLDGSTARTAALAQIVPELIRNCDVASMNQSGDLMILLRDADQTGAKAFTARLQETVQGKFKSEPTIWVRTFPFSGRSG